MRRLFLYYRREPERDRWIAGDRLIRPLVRRLVRGPGRRSGLDTVFANLCAGLDRIGAAYEVNAPFGKISSGDRVAVLGVGRRCLDGYDRPNPVVAGIGLMTHPSEWPTLCQDYPVVRYLQHSEWANNVYKPYFGDRCTIWPVGIDTDHWQPGAGEEKTTDFLIYDKILWHREDRAGDLLGPIRDELLRRSLSFEILRYGLYDPASYRAALARCRAMIFLSAHESQGIAAQEALSSGLPLLAWDPGVLQDPQGTGWGTIPTTSVPWFDHRCGLRFRDAAEFATELPRFLAQLRAGQFRPRAYILEHLTLAASARRFLDIIDSVPDSWG